MRLRRSPLSCSRLCLALLAAGCAACAGPAPRGGGQEARRNLARVGLELQEEEEALVPESRRGRAVPCRVIAGFTAPALEPHPAGYLIVGVGDGDEAGASAILEALARLRSGEALMLRVQRNPYLSPDAEWWEARVVLRLP